MKMFTTNYFYFANILAILAYLFKKTYMPNQPVFSNNKVERLLIILQKKIKTSFLRKTKPHKIFKLTHFSY